jgi:hypothetical protein
MLPTPCALALRKFQTEALPIVRILSFRAPRGICCRVPHPIRRAVCDLRVGILIYIIQDLSLGNFSEKNLRCLRRCSDLRPGDRPRIRRHPRPDRHVRVPQRWLPARRLCAPTAKFNPSQRAKIKDQRLPHNPHSLDQSLPQAANPNLNRYCEVE